MKTSGDTLKQTFSTENKDCNKIIDMLRKHLRPIYPKIIGYTFEEALLATLNNNPILIINPRGHYDL